MTLNDIALTVAPAIALLCNLYLLLTLLSAKKNPTIRAFMYLLCAFILWTGGSMMMWLKLYPSVGFWWYVSLTGIFLVPYFYYILILHYTNQKGGFLKIVWGILTVVIVILNFFDVFMTTPVLKSVGGRDVLVFTVHYIPSVFPVLLTLLIFFSIGSVINRSIKSGSSTAKYYTPLYIGVAIMLAGVLIDTIPAVSILPNDTIACALNAVCLYYAFYKKRFYALTQMTSRGGVSFISVCITAGLIAAFFPAIDSFTNSVIIASDQLQMTLIVIFFSTLAIIFFSLLNRLHDSLFVKEQTLWDNRLRELSVAANSTLEFQEVIGVFRNMLQESFHGTHITIFSLTGDKASFISVNGSYFIETPRRYGIEHPLVRFISQYERAVEYSEFKRSPTFKSLWESEKIDLDSMDVALLVPLRSDKELVGFVVVSNPPSKQHFGFNEIAFLESAVSVVGISLNNARLYQQIREEAQMDSLTGLYNRRYLMDELDRCLEKHHDRAISLILFSLDDFSLYNELYGSNEGDRILCTFAGILKAVFGQTATLVRFSGKEFVALVPGCDTRNAMDFAERAKELLSRKISDTVDATKKFLTFSAGICTYPSVAANMNQLLSYASIAVYSAKQHGKNQIVMYSHANTEIDTEDSISSFNTELSTTIFALTAAIDAKDHYTFNHSQAVSRYAMQIAEHAGLDKDHVEIIRQAGLLHDIGKIGIPDAILTKSGKLTQEEFVIMRQHVERSIEMIRHLPSMDYVIPTVLGHHERFDGRGYPRGIRGEDIPIGARCMAIADSFDAMISRRSYKEAISVEDALTEITNNLGTQFDPKLGALFVNLVKNGTITAEYY